MAAAPQLGLLTPSAQGIPLLRESSPVSSSQRCVDTQASPTNSPDSPEPILLCLLTGSLYPLLSISDLSRGAVTVLLAAQKVPTHHHVLNSSVSTSSYTLVLLTSLELLSSLLLVCSSVTLAFSVPSICQGLCTFRAVTQKHPLSPSLVSELTGFSSHISGSLPSPF